MDDVDCTGSEASLFSCTHTTSHNCAHTQDAGVQCVPREFIACFQILFIFFLSLLHSYLFVSSPFFIFLSFFTSFLLLYAFPCAGCTHGTVRLKGGMYSFEGRVEVCVNGLWGTVCHDSWSSADAALGCKYFGYSTYGKSICCRVGTYAY